MKHMNIEFTNGRRLFLDKAKSYDLRYTEDARVGVFKIKEEDGRTVLINWDHILFVTCKEGKDDAEGERRDDGEIH